MKIIEPRFEIEFLEDADTLLKRLERIARNCYKSEDKITQDSKEKFLHGLLNDRKHFPIFEFGDMIVRIICDRGVTHEIVRHRLCSFAQESTRYCNYSKGKFGGEITVIPMMDGLTDEQKQRRIDLWNQTEKVYLQEIAEGVKPQQARDMLPTCLKTEIIWKANIVEWRHIFKMRAVNKGAHPQMRKIMIPLLEEVKKRISILFDDLIVEG